MTSELLTAEQAAVRVADGIATTVETAEDLLGRLAFPKDPGNADHRAAAAEDYAEADRCVNELHRAWSHGEEKRTELTKPLNDVIKKINAAFKVKLDPIQELKNQLRQRMSGYAREELSWKRAEEDRRRREEIRKREDEQIRKAESAADLGMNRTAERILEQPIVAPKVVVTGATDQARSTTTVKWSARVTDKMAFLRGVLEGRINIDYVSIDEAAVRRAAAALKDTMKWPGVEVFEDVQIGSRR